MPHEERGDRVVWDDAHRKQVQTLFAYVVGGFLIFAGTILLILLYVWERATPVSVGAALLVMVFGLIAAMRDTFMPVFSALLVKAPGKRVKMVDDDGDGIPDRIEGVD